MKLLTLTSLLLMIGNIFAQEVPKIILATPTIIKGITKPEVQIFFSIDPTFVKVDSLMSDKQGNFEYLLPQKLEVGTNVFVWTSNENQIDFQRIVVKIKDADIILRELTTELDFSKKFSTSAASGTTLNYKVTIWNTNFSIPLARFNFTKSATNKTGDLILFNSIGAGFGISWGELEETRNNQGIVRDQEFTSTGGIHLGFLFSAGTGEDTKNVFAPTFNLSLLDFQLGFGYELGTLSADQKPTFITLSYAIPLYKLKKGAFYIWKGSKPINSILDGGQGG